MDAKKNINDLLKRINNYIHADKLIVRKIIALKNKKNEIFKKDPYYFCNKTLIKKINCLITDYNRIKLKTDPDESCCICLEKCEFDKRKYFICRHFICKLCFSSFDYKAEYTKCPICRAVIRVFNHSDRYAIICTGIPTNHYIFENGGYESICVAYIPEFKNEKNRIFHNITYNDDSKSKYDFVDHVHELFENGYNIVLQKHEIVIKWMNEIMLKELAIDQRFIYE